MFWPEFSLLFRNTARLKDVKQASLLKLYIKIRFDASKTDINKNRIVRVGSKYGSLLNHIDFHHLGLLLLFHEHCGAKGRKK